jgi:hypothetical protein
MWRSSRHRAADVLDELGCAWSETMSNIIIPYEHQSSPKTSEAERVVREASEDLRTGRFQPVIKHGMDGYFDSGPSEWLSQHPRVQEAVAKLQHQVRDKTNAEYLEKAEMLYEVNAMARAKGKWDGQRRWQGRENEEMRLVNVMHAHAFLRKLCDHGVRADIFRQPSSAIWLGPKAAGRIGVYAMVCGQAAKEEHFGVVDRVNLMISNGDFQKLTGTLQQNVMNEFNLAVQGIKKHLPAAARVAMIQDNYSPEWSLFRFDEYDCPTTERYHGWRTTLLSLILRGVLTEKQAHEVFGAPMGPASEFYRMQLQQHRQLMMGLTQ